MWHFESGRYGSVELDGLNVLYLAHSPGPVHLGNLKSLFLLDERAKPEQRRAFEEMFARDSDVTPFSVFISLTSEWLGPLACRQRTVSLRQDN